MEIKLTEVSQSELIYYEYLENLQLDKRNLGPNQFYYRKYVFNTDSLFINYFYLNQRTRFLFLFRRLNGCQHKYSCIESTIRKLYQVISFYGVLRLPLYYLARNMQGAEDLIFDNKAFIAAEVCSLLLIGSLRSAGCFLRFMNEEIIT